MFPKMERMIVESATAAAAMAASQATTASTSSSVEAKTVAVATSAGGGKHSPLKKQDLFGRGNAAATAPVQEHVSEHDPNEPITLKCFESLF